MTVWNEGEATSQTGDSSILSVENLEKTFGVSRGLLDVIARRPVERVVALDEVSLSLRHNEVLGIVGESGSGKSTLARCLLGLYQPDSGSIHFDGDDVTELRGNKRRDVQRRMQMVFQDPYSSLNPQMSIGAAILEAGRVHDRVKVPDDEFVGHLLDLVGLSRSVANRRPRALSGGQRQRVAIARALAVEPEVLVADEAVSALDVSVQGQILNLFSSLCDELGLAMIFIAHDLAVVAHLCDRVAIMYLGRIVEEGPVDAIFGSPQHPYTAGLLAAHPDPYALGALSEKSSVIEGDVPSPFQVPSGCRFRTRCAHAVERCAIDDPQLQVVDGGDQRAACHILPFRD